MTKPEFKRRFLKELQEAARLAEGQLGRSVPRHFVIELHGAGHSGVAMSPAAAVDALYLGGDRFYRIIDFGVVDVGSSAKTVFVRASDHKPSSWDRTWNSPPGSGPFKQLGPRVPIRVSTV
jgi:hypothetical protein